MNQHIGQQNESDMDVEEVEATSSGEAVLKKRCESGDSWLGFVDGGIVYESERFFYGVLIRYCLFHVRIARY